MENGIESAMIANRKKCQYIEFQSEKEMRPKWEVFLIRVKSKLITISERFSLVVLPNTENGLPLMIDFKIALTDFLF